jgi:hypothetical protein
VAQVTRGTTTCNLLLSGRWREGERGGGWRAYRGTNNRAAFAIVPPTDDHHLLTDNEVVHHCGTLAS